MGWGLGAKPGFFACICEARMGYPFDIITMIRQKVFFGMRGSFPTTPVVGRKGTGASAKVNAGIGPGFRNAIFIETRFNADLVYTLSLFQFSFSAHKYEPGKPPITQGDALLPPFFLSNA